MAVLNSEKARTVKTPSAKPLSAEEQAKEVAKLRNQLEAVEQARIAAQNQSDMKQAAKNAALKRYEALRKTNQSSSDERASRDAERKKLEGTPKEVAMNLLPDHGLGRGADQLPGEAVEQGVPLAGRRRQPDLLRVRHSAGPPR